MHDSITDFHATPPDFHYSNDQPNHPLKHQQPHRHDLILPSRVQCHPLYQQEQIHITVTTDDIIDALSVHQHGVATAYINCRWAKERRENIFNTRRLRRLTTATTMDFNGRTRKRSIIGKIIVVQQMAISIATVATTGPPVYMELT